MTIHRDGLTPVTEEQVQALLAFAKPYVGEAAYQSRAANTPMPPRRDMEDLSINDVRACFDAIPNTITDYDLYLAMGYATYHATGGSPRGYDRWRLWSMSNPNHDPDLCDGMWRRMHRHPPKRYTAGTLLHFARLADPAFQLTSRQITYIHPY